MINIIEYKLFQYCTISPLLICTVYQHLLGQIEQRNKVLILPVLPARPESGSGSSDHLPPAAKKASTRESRIEHNVDSLEIILHFIYRTIFSFQSAQGSCVLLLIKIKEKNIRITFVFI